MKTETQFEISNWAASLRQSKLVPSTLRACGVYLKESKEMETVCGTSLNYLRYMKVQCEAKKLNSASGTWKHL